MNRIMRLHLSWLCACVESTFQLDLRQVKIDPWIDPSEPRIETSVARILRSVRYSVLF